MKRRVVAIATLLLSAGLARADQCEVVTPEQAKAALQLLKKGVKFVELCEPCGDAKPGEPKRVETVELQPFASGAAQAPDPQQQTVKVNGTEEDLAYLFVQKAPGDSHYLNVSVLAKCPAQGVSAEIDLSKKAAAVSPGPVQAPSIDGHP